MLIKRTLLLVGWVMIMTSGIAPCLAADTTQDPLTWYHQGIAAKTHTDRIAAFEKALEGYLVQYNAMKEKGQTNAYLCYNIGNCYFNLKQLGQAIYYYKLALKLMPENERIQDNLSIALNKRVDALDIRSDTVLKTLLFFHYQLSVKNRVRLTILFSIICLLFFIPAIMRQHTLSRYLSSIAFGILLVLAVSLCVDYYSPHREGVVIIPAYARKDAGEAFMPVVSKPLGEGTIVRIISIRGEWLKVEFGEGTNGYIKRNDVKMII